jgi:hypothetical protein
VIDIAEIGGLDINPLLADVHGVITLDARASGSRRRWAWRPTT